MADTRPIENAPHDEELDVSSGESVPDGQEDEESEVSDGEDEVARPGVAAGQSQVTASPSKKPQVVTNQHFDEAVDVSSSESVDEDKPAAAPTTSEPAAPQQQRDSPKQEEGNSDGEEGSEESATSSDDEGDEDAAASHQGYNPADYANLQVTPEVKELFQYIARYKPQTIELETKLKPFIPDYVPAIGDIDPFLKIPRPDGKKDNLGLTVLDEPAAQQTDATVLDLQLRAMSTQASLQPTVVPSIEHAGQNPQKITNWIRDISELHRSNPPPNVHYSKAMPDVEFLMQMWSHDLEETFGSAMLPSAELNVDTKAYARIVCAILDIPVYSSLTESLHLLFTLYSEFKMSNQEALQPALD
eukprot:CAMPEP_0181346748 /NCGR_PEP_ID=MMETSP1101-20121128/33496_1 /TAXON_ID=46948 /ORGANISM="Rhodomonas abbreviata, Strain Caron Lab Isolate" /LENGTH=358 /DNA_ID=CAMNT_0023458887 /DNA_START=26 /DNA_END=1101 /DNA_ORIENTATION=-